MEVGAWESLDAILEGVLSGDLLYWVTSKGSDRDIWKGLIGRNSLPVYNLNYALLLDFCARYGMSIFNNIFKNRELHKCI